MTGFVASEKHLASLRQRLSHPRFTNGVRLTVEFLTTREAYEELLPPLMVPHDEPRMVVGIGRYESQVVGPYCGGSLSLISEYQGVPGGVGVCMWMNSLHAVDYGRDVLGEPKKLAESGIDVSADTAHAWVDRDGVRIIDIEAELTEELGGAAVTRYAYNYRSRPAVDGFTLEDPVALTRTGFDTNITSRRSATAKLQLSSSRFDPLGEIPIVELLSAELQSNELIGRTEVVGSVSADEFLPYHYGRLDDPGARYS